MPDTPTPGQPREPQPPEGRDRTGRLVWGAAAVMLVCCAGQSLLLAAGLGGLGAVTGAITGNAGLLAAAVIVVAGAATLMALRLRRRHTRDCPPPAPQRPGNTPDQPH